MGADSTPPACYAGNLALQLARERIPLAESLMKWPVGELILLGWLFGLHGAELVRNGCRWRPRCRLSLICAQTLA